jgi:hypothetical protein
MAGREPASGSLRTFVTDDPDRFVLLAARFLGMEIERPTLVELSDPWKTPQRLPLRRSA